MRSCRGRGSSGAGRGSKRPARGEAVMKRPVRGASMHAGARTSLLLTQALQALPLGHPHRVCEDGKWVREACFSD